MGRICVGAGFLLYSAHTASAPKGRESDVAQMKKTRYIYILSLLLLFLAPAYASSAFPLRILELGSAVPPFTLPTLGGGEADVLGADGEITVILFWGTDSEGMRTRGLELLRTLQTVGETYREQGVVVRSVNVDKDNREALNQLVTENGITVPVLLDVNEELYGTYGLFIFPSVAIVDRDGTLKTAVGYTHNLSEIVDGEVQVMLGLKTAEELEKEVHPEDMIEPPENVKKAIRRLNLGRKLVETRFPDMAGREFQKAVELDPENAEAHAELGAFYVHQGELDKALGELTLALGLLPESKKAHFALGALYRRTGESGKAIAELQRVLELDPTHAEALKELGAAYEDTGQIEQALEQYRKALSMIFEGKLVPE